MISDSELDRCKGKGEQLQARKSDGQPCGAQQGRERCCSWGGMAMCSLGSGGEKRGAKAGHPVLCVDLTTWIRTLPASAASSCQLHCPAEFLRHWHVSCAFLSQVVDWEMSMCKSLGCMGAVFIACTLWVLLLPEVVGY